MLKEGKKEVRSISGQVGKKVREMLKEPKGRKIFVLRGLSILLICILLTSKERERESDRSMGPRTRDLGYPSLLPSAYYLGPPVDGDRVTQRQRSVGIAWIHHKVTKEEGVRF